MRLMDRIWHARMSDHRLKLVAQCLAFEFQYRERRHLPPPEFIAMACALSRDEANAAVELLVENGVVLISPGDVAGGPQRYEFDHGVLSALADGSATMERLPLNTTGSCGAESQGDD